MSNKLMKISVKTPKGERTLVYQPVEGNEKEIVCLRGCVYKDVCDKIRDPREPDNEKLSFVDFCGDIGGDFTDEEKQKAIGQYVPKPGTIEENLSDFDIIKDLLKKNPVVRTNEIVEKVCSGWCDDYNSEHTNCNAQNGMCILRSIFINGTKK